MTHAAAEAPASRSLIDGVADTDIAATILRVFIGALFLAQAGLKLFIVAPAGMVAYFASLGLPGPLAYLVIVAELLGGLALILGAKAHWASLALMPILLDRHR